LVGISLEPEASSPERVVAETSPAEVERLLVPVEEVISPAAVARPLERAEEAI
jgi:hypothetical protein